MAGTSRSGRNGSLATDKTAPDGGPVRPDMPKDVGQKYDEVVSQLPAAILRRCDVHELLTLARLLAQSDKVADAMASDPLDHKTGRAFLNIVDRIHKLSAAFGLTPADRKRLSLETEEEVDEIAEFIRS